MLTSLGNCYRKLREFEKGLVYFQRALDIEPNNFYALFGMADCYRGMNEHEKSLYAWQEILKFDPQNKVILTRVGDAYRNMGDLDKAEDFYHQALNIEFDIYAVIGLAMIHKGRGNHMEAIESLTGLLVNNPKNPRLVIEIADSYLKLGNHSRAGDVLTRFIRIGGKNAQVSEMLEKIRNAVASGAAKGN